MGVGENVLVYRLGSLGDTVVALPAFHVVRRAFPDARITLLTNWPVAARAAPLDAVLGGGGFYDEVISYPVGTRKPSVLAGLLWSIRQRGIRTAIDLCAARTPRSVQRDRLFFRLAGVTRVVGSPKTAGDFSVQIDPRTGLYEAETRRLLRRLEEVGSVDLDEPSSWDLHLTSEEQAEGHRLLGGAGGCPRVVVSMGTKMPAKDWEEANWSKLIACLDRELPGHHLVLIGSKEEAARSVQCSRAWQGGITNLCGVASPRLVAAATAGARIFIGHDSGPLHLASAMQVPCVAIFAARNLPGHWYPHGSRHEVLYHQTDCFGCNLEVCVQERKRCILGISVDEVMEAVRRILTKNSKKTCPT